MSEITQEKRRPGLTLAVVGGALMLVGIALGGLSIARAIGGVVGLVGQESFSVPGQQSRELEAGSYVVFARIGSTAVQETIGTPFGVSAITVTGPAGQSIPVRRLTSTQRLTLGTDVFAGVAGFDAPTSGTYVVRVSEGGGLALVSGNIMSTVAGGLGSVAGVVAGALVGLIGLALLVVGLVRRFVRPSTPTTVSYAPPTLAPPPPPPVPAVPAGWYPDAGRPGGQRYWDGTTWTEHRA